MYVLVWYKATTGSIYHICEMYIDDCIVYGNTEVEFVSRLRSIFERFRLHKHLNVSLDIQN